MQVGGALGLAVLATLASTRTDDLLTSGSSTASALTDGYQLGLCGRCRPGADRAGRRDHGAAGTDGVAVEEEAAPAEAVSEAAWRRGFARKRCTGSHGVALGSGNSPPPISTGSRGGAGCGRTGPARRSHVPEAPNCSDDTSGGACGMKSG